MESSVLEKFKITLVHQSRILCSIVVKVRLSVCLLIYSLTHSIVSTTIKQLSNWLFTPERRKIITIALLLGFLGVCLFCLFLFLI